MRLSKWTRAIVLALGVAGVASVALAQGGGPGEEPGEELPNSLSVPAILIGGNPFGLVTGDGEEVVVPEEEGTDPLTGYPIDPLAFFYVQGIHYWQASCKGDLLTADVHAAWGDNLTGDAKLKVGSPIRVEMGLLADFPEDYGMTGWVVEKLDPSALDREAPYGTEAVDPDDDGVFQSIPITPFAEVRVYDGDAWLKIYDIDTPDEPIVEGPASAEINATGRIVYGYNLRVPATGTYVIEFTAPNVNILTADAGDNDGNTVTLEITVGSGGGGGGGGGGPGGGKGKGPPITPPGQQEK